MAAPTVAKPGAFVISLGDGATPTEAFTAPCGFTSKSARWNRGLGEVSIPDCDDPDAPLWISRDVETQSFSVTGEGVLAAEAIPVWLDVLDTTDAVSVQVEITYSTGVLEVAGKMHLESFETGAQQGQKVSANVSLQSDGAMATTWTAAP